MPSARLLSGLGAAVLFLTPGVVLAQAKPAGPTPPSQAQVQAAANNFRIMMSALQSDKVPQPVKNVLFVCIYSNPFAKISEGTDKAIAAKKADKNNPTIVLGAMAGVCGLKPEMLAKPATPPAKK